VYDAEVAEATQMLFMDPEVNLVPRLLLVPVLKPHPLHLQGLAGEVPHMWMQRVWPPPCWERGMV